MRGFEVEGLGVGDNMSELVWVMEWTSVLVIILPIPKKENRQTKYRKTKRKSRATKDKLFHCINRSENKLTLTDSPFRLLSCHFPLNHEVRA